MTLSYKTLLIACIPLSLQSMEEQKTTDKTEIMKLIKERGNELNSLYKQTYSFLEDYKEIPLITNLELVKIIDATNQLKAKKNTNNAGIKEYHIGLYSFMQHQYPMIKRTKSPYIDSNYVSLFFKKIEQYHNNLKKNSFVTPTLEHFIGKITNEAIKDAANTGIDLEFDINIIEINREKRLLADIPDEIAFAELQNLAQILTKILNADPKKIKILAEIFYADRVEPIAIKKL